MIRKASKKRGVAPKLKRAREIVRPLILANKPVNTHVLQRQSRLDGYPIARRTFDAAIWTELALRDEKPIDWETIPGPTQKKLETALQRLELDFTYRVDERVQERLRQTVIPAKLRKAAELVERITRRRGVMSKADYNRVRIALHPDTYGQVGGDELNRLSQLWEESQPFLVAEREHPIASQYGLSESLDELLRRRKAS